MFINCKYLVFILIFIVKLSSYFCSVLVWGRGRFNLPLLFIWVWSCSWLLTLNFTLWQYCCRKIQHQLLNVKGCVLVYFVAIFVAFIQGHLCYGTPESKIYSAAGDCLTVSTLTIHNLKNFWSYIKAQGSISSSSEWFLFLNITLYNSIFLLFQKYPPFGWRKYRGQKSATVGLWRYTEEH